MVDTFLALTDVLEHELFRRAERCGWSPTPSAQLLRSEGSEGLQSLLAALPNLPASAHFQGQLPRRRRAFELRPADLSLLLCGIDSANIDESYREALWWTGLVRSDLTLSKRGDLHLFLIAPQGTREDPAWLARRSRIESDERFCRKFLWLPSTEPNLEEVAAFLDRTFLAHPWEGRSAEPRSLDPLEQLLDHASTGVQLSANELRHWLATLGATDASAGQQLAEALVGHLDANS